MILLTENTAKAKPQVQGKTVCIYHKSYEPPDGPWHYVVFDEFKKDARKFLDNQESMIFVGLNKAMTPSNRTEMVFEVLFNKTKELHKVSIDHTLFISEPWRAWFHFGLLGVKYRQYTYSYIAESQYKAWLDEFREDDPFSLDEIAKWGKDVIISDYQNWFDELDVEIVELFEEYKIEYEKLKKECFEDEQSIKRIIKRLSDFVSTKCSERKVPAPHQLFRAKKHKIVITDFPVDQWLLGELRRLVELTNGIAGVFHHGYG